MADEIGKKAGDWAEKKSKEWEKRGDEIGKKVEKPAEYIVTIIVNIIMIYILGRLEDWLPFLTDSFGAVLPLFYISIIATIFANFIFLLYNESIFVGIIKALLNVWSIIVLVSVYYIFPFDFSAYSANWDLIVKIILIVAIAGTIIGTVVESIKTLTKKGTF